MDLNDLRYFALTVEHGGFSAAARQAHIPKSKLSRRVALLEDRLGVRLLQRTTRKLALTEAGRRYYEHCAAMLVEAQAAQSAVEQLRSEPSGTVRMTCPTAMLQVYVGRVIADFMRQHPKVRVELDATDRLVNVIEERFDLAIRTRNAGLNDPGLVARRLASGRLVLVGSPAYLEGRGEIDSPEQAAALDTIGSLIEGPEQVWPLVAADGRSGRFPHHPRFLCTDFVVQRQAALSDVGIGLLPLRLVWTALQDGTLVRVAKDWGTPEQDIHLVYASRRGMLPSVRALVDYLVRQVPLAMGE